MAETRAEAKRAESPGALLRLARQEAGLEPAEVARRLNWLPGYVGIIEQDDYGALRNPSFAQGYVRAYGKLVGVNELRLQQAFAELQSERADELARNRVARQPLHLQRTGKGVVIGLATLALLVAALWWQGGRGTDGTQAEQEAAAGAATQLSVGN